MDIRETLYRYLLLFEELNLPGIGTLRLRKDPAVYDITEKSFHSPSYSYTFDQLDVRIVRKLHRWVSTEMDVSEYEAIRMINDFSYEFKNMITERRPMKWDNVGDFRKDEYGNILFHSQEAPVVYSDPEFAEKVVHENSLHTILVGDAEISSAILPEELTETAEKKDYSSLIAYILLILAIAFISIYFISNGLSVSSAANQSGLEVKEIANSQ